MNERQKKLFFWSIIVGLCGWLGWELECEKRKAEREIEQAIKRHEIQSKYRE